MNQVRSSFGFRPPVFLSSPFFSLLTLAGALWLLPAGSLTLQAQDFPGNGTLALSYSGQFIVTGSPVKSPLLSLSAVTTNTSFVRLAPALLSVSAERIKQTLYHLLAVPAGSPWQGKIYLALHPALWTDENVTVVSRPIDQSWSYLVQLPDVVQEDRFMRGMTGVLLLEMANRSAGADGHAAEIPAWLIEGLSRQILQDELSKAVLSSPDRPLGGPPPREAAAHERELDPLAGTRQLLRKYPALTFNQLSWPTAGQLAGEDDGVYTASAQLLVTELLKINGGPARMQRMLASLPRCYNWQTAFQNAWRDRFPQTLDLEKWWALQVVGFLSHAPGPAWTPAFSAGRLNELLRVPVAVRVSSNTLPSHAEMNLQTVLQHFGLEQRNEIFQTHLRDLRIAQLRMAPQFIALTDEYCRVMAGYLGERLEPAPRQSSPRHPVPAPGHLPAGQVIKKLDALDARRRTLEASIQGNTMQAVSNVNVVPAGPVNLTGARSKL